jgi:hypothetical protein
VIASTMRSSSRGVGVGCEDMQICRLVISALGHCVHRLYGCNSAIPPVVFHLAFEDAEQSYTSSRGAIAVNPIEQIWFVFLRFWTDPNCSEMVPGSAYSEERKDR